MVHKTGYTTISNLETIHISPFQRADFLVAPYAPALASTFILAVLQFYTGSLIYGREAIFNLSRLVRILDRRRIYSRLFCKV